MREHLTPDDITAYWARGIQPERLQWVTEHLEACERCREALNGSPEAITAAARLRVQLTADPHLDYDLLTGFLDETLIPDQLADARRHLQGCRRCAEDLEAVRAVSLPEVRPQPEPVPAPFPEPQRPRRRRLLGWIFGPAVAAAAVGGFWLGRLQPAVRQPLPPAPAPTGQEAQIAALLRQVEQLRHQLAPHKTVTKLPTPKPFVGAVPRRKHPASSKRVVTRALPELVPDAAATAILRLPATVTSLFLPGEVVRGTPGSGDWMQGLAPARTVIDDERPEFSWQTGPGAWTYEVIVVPVDRKGETLHSGRITAPAWRPLVPLQRGQVYTWQVTGVSPEGRPFVTPSPKPRFRVLDDAAHRELIAARMRYVANPLALGVILAEHGLLLEAQTQFDAYARTRGATPRVRSFLAQVRNGLQAPPAPAGSPDGRSPLLASPSVGVDAAGRRYPRMAEAYARIRERYQLSSPDDWVSQYGPGDEGRIQAFKSTKVDEARLVTRSGPGGAPAYCVAGEILRKYEGTKSNAGTGGAFGPLGWTVSDLADAPLSRNGHRSLVQRFERGAIYHITTGPRKDYTFEIHDQPEANLFIYQRYEELGGCQGNQHPDPDLRYHPGLPDDNIVLAATNPRTGQTGFLGRFEGCQIYGVRGRGTFVIAGKIHEKFEILGGTDDPIGFPISDRMKTGESGANPGMEGVAQDFEGGTLYWRRKGENWNDEAYLVAGELLKAYLALGGVKGTLGFPTAAAALLTSPAGTKGTRQEFEGGLLLSSRLGTFWLPSTHATRYEPKLGFPLEAPQPDGRQRFEGGVLPPVAP